MAVFDKVKQIRKNNLLQTMAATPHQRRLPNIAHVKSVGIIFRASTPDYQKMIDLFASHLQHSRIQVEKIEIPATDEALVDHNGLPLPEFIYSFTRRSYDLVVDCTSGEDFFGMYVLLSTKCSLRIVYHDLDLPLMPLTAQVYDLIIYGHGPQNIQEYLKGLLSVLVNIRK